MTKINYQKMSAADIIFALEGNGIKCFKKETLSDLRKKAEDFNNGKLKGTFTKSDYSWNAIRPAIILAHNTGNRKALNEPTCAKVKVSKESLEQWKHVCKNLQATVWDYVLIRRSPEASAQEVEKKRSAIFPAWKEIIKNGEASIFHNRLHLLEADIEDLIGFAWVFLATEKGTVTASETEELFRKKVESLLGCLIARNNLMTEAEAEVVTNYYRTAREIKKLKDTINGKGDRVGLTKEIANLQSTHDRQKAILKQLGAEEDIAEKMLNTIANMLQEKRDQKEEAEKKLKEAEKALPELKEKANAILANYNKIK